MQEKLFLVNKSMAYSIEHLKKKPVAELTIVADYVLSSFNSLAILATEGLINLTDYHLIAKQIQDEDEHHFQLDKQDDCLDIVVNNELQIYINTTGNYYHLNLYAYNGDVSDKDKDWDSDYISSTYANYEVIKDIITAREND